MEMTKDKGNVIHLFGNDQFPRRLYIVKKASYSWLKERFKCIDGEELEEYSREEAKAITYPDVEYVGTKEFGILIYILDKLSVSDCAHEAAHFVLELYRAMGDEVSLHNQEVFAYLVGWATDCIHQVVTNRYKPTYDGSREIEG